MTDSPSSPTPLDSLEREVDELLSFCEEFNAQYRLLQQHTHQMNQQNQTLMDTQQKAQRRLDVLIDNLKALEKPHVSE